MLDGVRRRLRRLRGRLAALAILLTGVLTWLLDLEIPSAFSTALLVLLTDPGRFLSVAGVAVSTSVVYVATVALSASVVAVVFVVWRHEFYERRARYLYSTTQADDHVLVPMRGETDDTTALFGVRIATAHDAGKVVLLDVVDDDAIAAAERRLLEEHGDVDVDEPDAVDGHHAAAPDVREQAERSAADEAATELERRAARIETRVGVPCEVVVAVEDDITVTSLLDAARDTNCDPDGTSTRFVRDLFRRDIDGIAFESKTGRTDWKRVMVPVRAAGQLAHAMVDYGQRLAGKVGTVSVCTCVGDERSRRRAESMLANLTETSDARCETRVSCSSLAEFLERNEAHYDLVVFGAHDYGSRFAVSQAFERAQETETDVAVVHTR